MALSKIQKKVLEVLAKSSLNNKFYWTGGTLLAEKYLQHRESQDIDLFSDNSFSYQEILPLVHQIQKETKLKEIEENKIFSRFEFFIHNEIPTIPIQHAKEIITSIFKESRMIREIDREEREVVLVEPSQEIDETANYEVEEIRSHLLQINPYRFESLVRDIVESNGFINVSVTPRSQDGGIDVNGYVADFNYFFSKTHVQFQVKRWRHSVGSVEINNFRGALHTTAKGVFVTTSHFTKAAIQEAEHSVKPCISVIDGFRFSKLIKESALNINKYL